MPNFNRNPTGKNQWGSYTDDEKKAIWDDYIASTHLTQKEFAAKHNISQPAMSRLLTRLMKEFTKTKRDPDDSNYYL